MQRPEIVTFTGADDAANVGMMCTLSERFPYIEWGILFSPKMQGRGRYPSLEKVHTMIHELRAAGARVAAHICGGHSRSLIETGVIAAPEIEVLLHAENFDRVQVNTSDPYLSPLRIGAWARSRGLLPIVQTRSESVFPGDDAVEWLYDASGGRGIVSDTWPQQAVAGRRVGYAGGLGPENIVGAVDAASRLADAYWLDMETRVRDEHDRFDLNKVFTACERMEAALTPGF